MKSHEKFNLDRTYKYFPGVAIIHFVKDNNLIELLSSLKDDMIQSNLFDKYVFLPKSSYHMTLSDLLIYNQSHLAEENNIDKYVYKKLSQDLFEINVWMEVTRISARKVHLIPKTKEDKHVLDEFRKVVSKKLNIHFDDTYKFHISLSYQLDNRTEEEKNEIEIFLEQFNKNYLDSFNPILINFGELVVFNDMAEFKNIKDGRSTLKRQPTR